MNYYYGFLQLVFGNLLEIIFFNLYKKVFYGTLWTKYISKQYQKKKGILGLYLHNYYIIRNYMCILNLTIYSNTLIIKQIHCNCKKNLLKVERTM